MRARRSTAALAFVACTTAWSGTALAAPPVAQDSGISDGIDRPIHDYSGEGDASSMEVNPGLINTVRGVDFVFRGYEPIHDYARGRGYGGFLSLNTGLGIALGLAIQWLDPGFRDERFDDEVALHPSATKIGGVLSTGDRLGKVVSIGLGIHGLRREGVWLRSPDLDIGLVARMTRFASLGAMFRFAPVNVNDDRRIRANQTITGELAVRPLGTRLVELAGGVGLRADPDDGGFRALGITDVFGRGRMALRWQGVTLAGEVEEVPVTTLDDQSLAVTARGKTVRGSVALALAWDYVMAEVGTHFGLGDSVDGVGFAVRTSTARLGRVVPVRPVVAERFVLAAIDGDRDLVAMLERLEVAKKAGKRSVLLVEADGLDVGWGDARELREALVSVRNAGGHVFAYVENPSLRDYFVATAAERVFLHPLGELDVHGIAARRFYFKDALAKIGVRAETEHIAEYKSAHETWTRAERSAADREQTTALLEDTLAVVVEDIARARGKSLAEVRALIDQGPVGPTVARDGWVDELTHRDERAEAISDTIGKPVDVIEEVPKTGHQDPEWTPERYVAVVLVEGTIVEGRSRNIPILNIKMAGADTITELLGDLGLDRRCEGIILRVDSPGGSAMASERIWRAVHLTHEAWKKDPRRAPPIVVSMGDTAASGGYYVALGSDAVYVQPTTVTGSIGVVTVHFDVSGLLDKLGIEVETLEAGDNPWANGVWKPWTASQRERIRASMDRTYETFTTRVAEGRGIEVARVQELARGRVYSGKSAAALDLVDGLGGFAQALAEIRKRSRLHPRAEVALRVLPAKPTLLQLILRGAGSLIEDRTPRLGTRRREREPERLGNALPAVLEAELARLPLSMLWLPQSRPSTITSSFVDVR